MLSRLEGAIRWSLAPLASGYRTRPSSGVFLTHHSLFLPRRLPRKEAVSGNDSLHGLDQIQRFHRLGQVGAESGFERAPAIFRPAEGRQCNDGRA